MSVTTLGRYRILRELGRGAMGRVYLAHDSAIDRPVALKTMQAIAALPEAERAPARERFAREARAAGRLSHPGIVTIFDVGESEGIPYLAMEYVEGTTLDAYAAAGNLLPLGEAVELVALAAEALHVAHAAGIVHRDIKAGNLMRVGPGQLKLLDFGLAKSPLTALTQEGALLGTPATMAPEQIRGAAVDGRTDLFSLAIVLFELVSGRKPFPGDSVSAILYRIVHEEPELQGPELAALPPSLHAFFRRALAKDPEERYPDGRTFARALRDAARPGAPRPAPEVPAPPPPRLRPGGLALLPWVAAAAVVLGGAGWAVIRLGTAPTHAPIAAGGVVRVRTDPAGLPVTLDGRPLGSGSVELPAAPPFGTLVLTQACRTVTRALSAADAGGEIVLVPDPVRASVPVAPGLAGATVAVNGGPARPAPAEVDLDLCAPHTVEISAPGYRPVRVELPAGARPLEARTLLAGAVLERIPEGTLRLPSPRFAVTWHVDGERLPAGEHRLPEGTHEVRAVNEAVWLDRTAEVEVRAGETVTAPLPARLADLVVQAFPANCRVALRRGAGEAWKDVDDTPVRTAIAPGTYQVRVTHAPTGQTQERDVRLAPGVNPPVRFAFRRGA